MESTGMEVATKRSDQRAGWGRSCSAWHPLGVGLVLAVWTLALVGCGKSPAVDRGGKSIEPGAAATNTQIAPKDSVAMVGFFEDSPFAAAFRAGADTRAKDRDREIVWIDVAEGKKQPDVIKRLIQEKYAGICVRSLDAESLVQTVAAARAAKIPLVMCERPMAFASSTDAADDGPILVVTDHAHCGQIIAEHARELMGEKGKLLVVGKPSDADIGPEADRARNVAFALKDSEIEVIDGNALSSEGVLEILNRFASDTAPDSAAIIAVAVDDARQVLQWKQSTDGASFRDVPVLGFGSWNSAAQSLKSGALSALALEDPRGMGGFAVDAIFAAIEGEPFGGNLLTIDEYLATQDNLKDERTNELLKENVR